MTLDVIGEQTQQQVGADPRGQAMVDGTHLEIDGLEAAEGALNHAEPLVGLDRLLAVELCLRQAGANHVEAVEGGLGGDAVGLRR